MNIECKNCKSKNLFVEIQKDKRGLYCGECGKWQKWLTKEELQICKFNDIKIINKIDTKDIKVTDEKINELDSLILQIEEYSKRKSLSDTYLREHECNTREDIGIGEYAYGIVLVPEDWVLPYLKELSNIWKNKLGKGGLNE